MENRTVSVLPFPGEGPIKASRLNRLLTVWATAFFEWIGFRRHGCICETPLLGLVVKSSKAVLLGEAHTLRFLSRRTTLPVPKVYCAFKHEKNGFTYIVMQKMAGHMSGMNFTKRSEESKANLLADLKTKMDELRSTEPPPDTGVHNVVGGPMHDIKVSFNEMIGPFSTVDQFHYWLRGEFDEKPNEELYESKETFELVKEVLDFHRSRPWTLKFTHADLNHGNILVQGDRITGIIDWASSGWYPDYWEYARLILGTTGAHCQKKYAHQFLEPFPDDLLHEATRTMIMEH